MIAIDAGTHRVIGSSRFHGDDEARSEIEIGWTFLALVGLQNFRSQRAVEKIGALCVGSRLDAEGRESYVHQLTASTFAPERVQRR